MNDDACATSTAHAAAPCNARRSAAASPARPELSRRTLGLAAFAALGFLALAPPPSFAADGEIVSLRVQREGRARSSRPLSLSFRAFGHGFDLVLEKNESLIAPGAKVVSIGGQPTESVLLPTGWIGRVEGRPEIEARLVLEGDQARGYVRSGAGTFVFEPSADPAAVADAHVVRRAEDVMAEGGPIACGADDDANVAMPAPKGNARSTQPLIMPVLDVSVVADAAFYRRFGAGSAARVQEIFNAVDGIYRASLGITVQIAQLVLYQTDAAQPFSATADAGELLSQLSNARETDPLLAISAGAVTHLLAGRGIGGPEGIAWIAGVCSDHYGAGVSSITSEPGYLASILVAHELGHNMGASHDGPSGYGCGSTPFGSIMWPLLESGLDDSFSACSRARIAAQLPIAPCLAASVPTDCGNGRIDDGEECDNGLLTSGDCCSQACTLVAAGIPCGVSDDLCYDAICDGGGTCAEVPNEAPCSSEDACTTARCSDGVCLASEEPREFDSLTARFHVGSNGMVDSAKLAGLVSMFEVGSSPATDGLEIVTMLGSATAYQEFIPAHRWVSKKAGSYAYKTTARVPGTVRSAKVRFSAVTGRASFNFTMAPPMAGMAPALPQIFVLAGTRSDGQCGTSPALQCLRRGSTYSCN